MATRPAGTDGTDHAFRQTVDKKYQTAPEMRAGAAEMALWQLGATSLPLIWHLYRQVTTGDFTPNSTHYLSAASIICFLAWHLGRPGSARESLGLFTLSALACVAAAVVKGANIFFMKLEAPKALQFFAMMKIWAESFVDDRSGKDRYVQMMNNVELICHGMTMLLLVACPYGIMRYVLAQRKALAKLRPAKAAAAAKKKK